MPDHLNTRIFIIKYFNVVIVHDDIVTTVGEWLLLNSYLCEFATVNISFEGFQSWICFGNAQ